MSWLRVDDAFARHRKVLSVPRARRKAAVGLWLLAGTWIAQNLTDGHLPAYMLDEFDATPDEVSDLLSATLWERDGDDYRMHDYLDYNPSKEQVLAERDAAKLRQRRARERSTEKRHADSSGEVQAKSRRDIQRDSGVTSGEVRAASRSPRPVPTRPVPQGGDARKGVTSATDPEPPLRCPTHRTTTTPPPCGACGDARREHDAWARTQQPQARPNLTTPCQDHPQHPAGRCPPCEAKAVPSPLDRSRKVATS